VCSHLCCVKGLRHVFLSFFLQRALYICACIAFLVSKDEIFFFFQISFFTNEDDYSFSNFPSAQSRVCACVLIFAALRGWGMCVCVCVCVSVRANVSE